jgi:hypothetical protein
VADGRKRKEKLEARFAEWYYLIGGDAFKKLRLDRAALVKPKEKKEEGKKDDHDHEGIKVPLKAPEKPSEKAPEKKADEKPAEKPAEKKQ